MRRRQLTRHTDPDTHIIVVFLFPLNRPIVHFIIEYFSSTTRESNENNDDGHKHRVSSGPPVGA